MSSGPILIFDKSSLESLNIDAAGILDPFYRCGADERLSDIKAVQNPSIRKTNPYCGFCVCRAQTPPATPLLRFDRAKQQVPERIEESPQLRAENQNSERFSRWSFRLFTFTQYIMGGLLASFFIQQKAGPSNDRWVRRSRSARIFGKSALSP